MGSVCVKEGVFSGISLCCTFCHHRVVTVHVKEELGLN